MKHGSCVFQGRRGLAELNYYDALCPLAGNNTMHRPPTRGPEQKTRPCTAHATHVRARARARGTARTLYKTRHCVGGLQAACAVSPPILKMHSSLDHKKIASSTLKIFPAIFQALVMALSEREKDGRKEGRKEGEEGKHRAEGWQCKRCTSACLRERCSSLQNVEFA